MGRDRSELLAGTLDLLILKTLSVTPLHGYGIAQQIKRLSSDALRIEEGSLYPAVQRLQARGLVVSEWKRSPTGRRARYYRLTAAGRRQLTQEEASFRDSVNAITRVLRGVTS
jgi:PadR family transcriptional regulator